MKNDLTENDLKRWYWIRLKWRHKLGLCWKAKQGYECRGTHGYEECGGA